MTLSANDLLRLEARMQVLKAAGQPFAMATVVRTVNATSAKPGGKALLDRDGAILIGWIGGGCARGAIGRAARDAIRLGAPQFISLRPQELLETGGVTPGETRDGVVYARNGCPSKGTMDVFVEPVLPLPRLVICGSGLVAMALQDMGQRFDYDVRIFDADQHPSGPDPQDMEGADYIVVATQGAGDRAALRQAIESAAPYVSFVGSARKFATLAERIKADAPHLANRLAVVRAPAGLDIKAITPEEIALSILAQITQVRRRRDTAEGRNDV